MQSLKLRSEGITIRRLPAACAGLLLIALALILNEWVIAGFLNPDVGLQSTSIRITFWLFDLLLLLTGLSLIFSSNAPFVCCASFLASSFVIFALLELLPPSSIRQLGLSSIRYYALRERYLPDDGLVFRTRAFYRIEHSEYRGDLYSSSYGIQVPPIPYRALYDRNGFRTANATRFVQVVVLGDSYMEFGVDEADTFSERFSRLSQLSTINFGHGGYGPFHYLAVLKRYGIQHKPKFALVAFFEGNDMTDVGQYLRWREGRSYYDYDMLLRDLQPRNLLRRYMRASGDAMRNLGSRIAHLADGHGEIGARTGQNIHPELVILNVGRENIKTVFHYRLDTRGAKDLLQDAAWGELKNILTQLRQIALDSNIVPIVIFIPTKTHVYAEYSTMDSGEHWLKIRAAQIAAKGNTEAALFQLCRDVDVRFISLTPVFERAAREGKFLYYPLDTHWNSEAREIAASLIARDLRPELKK